MKYKDYYAALEVERGADADTIKKAYRRLARKYHPDVSKEADAEAKFKDLSEAYETLRDPDKRAAYDALGSRPAGEEFTAPRDWREHFGQGASFEGFEDLDLGDLLDQLRGGRGGGGRYASSGPRPGEDYDVSAELSLEDAHRGTTMSLHLQRPEGPQELQVTIPPGVVEGQKLRLRGRGGPGRNGGASGDIYVHLHLKPHARYRVNGRDLFFELALAPWEAALGAEVTVPTLDGEVVLTVPPGTHSAQRLRLRNRGLGSSAARGDLYAVVHIEVPTKLSDRERELFGQLAKASTFNPRNTHKEARA